jgi:hypothetical protein
MKKIIMITLIIISGCSVSNIKQKETVPTVPEETLGFKLICSSIDCYRYAKLKIYVYDNLNNPVDGATISDNIMNEKDSINPKIIEKY